MKIMPPDARRKIAQTSLEGANEKEAKDKQALEAASSVKSLALKSYEDPARALIASFKHEDETGWALFQVAVEALIKELEAFRGVRYNSINPITTTVEETGSAAIVKDMIDWTARAQKHVAKKSDEGDASTGRKFAIRKSPVPTGDGSVLDFALQVETEDSRVVASALKLLPDKSDDDVRCYFHH